MTGASLCSPKGPLAGARGSGGAGAGGAPSRRRQPRLARRAAIAALVLGLAGCAPTKNFFKGLFGMLPPPPPCPRVYILADAASVAKFRPGPGRDLTDVLHEGEIDDFRAACEHDIDARTKIGTLKLELALDIRAERGPANRDRQARYEYFVSLADSARNVLQKEVFAATARFEGNVTRFVFTDEPVSLNVPLKAGQTGANFEIFVGFQLSKEEIELNRLKRGGHAR